MSYSMGSLDGIKDILLVNPSGKLESNEIRTMLDEYFESPVGKVLIDLRDVTFGEITRTEMVYIVERFKDPHVGHSKKAAVISNSDEVLGFSMIMLKIAEMENIPTKYRIFRDIEEAKEWLKD